MEAIFGTIVGFVAFGTIWFFLLRPKKDQMSNDELKIKEDELKNAQIDLATRDAELKAAIDARKDLDKQLNDKKKRLLIFIKKLMALLMEWVNINQSLIKL